MTTGTPDNVSVVGTEDLFGELLAYLAEAGRARHTVALTGGSTPKAFYKWIRANGGLDPAMQDGIHWTVSDERHVPLDSPDSNFGNADRLLLGPEGVPKARKHAWDTSLPPAECARDYAARWADQGGADRTYDLCFLGLGEDGHTASLFPGSPLLAEDPPEFFRSVDAGERGHRLTITPAGLALCGKIVVVATGERKREAVERVFLGEEEPTTCPSRLLLRFGDKVRWLLDRAAASGLRKSRDSGEE
jgi:6-phosphogluconolactonase